MRVKALENHDDWMRATERTSDKRSRKPTKNSERPRVDWVWKAGGRTHMRVTVTSDHLTAALGNGCSSLCLSAYLEVGNPWPSNFPPALNFPSEFP